MEIICGYTENIHSFISAYMLCIICISPLAKILSNWRKVSGIHVPQRNLFPPPTNWLSGVVSVVINLEHGSIKHNQIQRFIMVTCSLKFMKL